MNTVSRIIWLLLNVFFGGALACTFFYWSGCDMQMPLIFKNFISTNLPILYPLFDVPYVHITEFSSSVITKLIFNAFLYAIFGFIHTLFAQEFVHTFLRRTLFPQQTLRTVYCILVSITVFIIMGFWQHTNIQLWDLLPPTMTIYEQQWILIVLVSITIGPALYVIFKFNPLEFYGMKQIFSESESSKCPFSSSVGLEKRTTGNQTLITSGLFRLCRHPVYLFTILSLLITPVMSLDRFALMIYTCLYAFIGIQFEERKLIKIFGENYNNYRKNVPAIIPFPISKTKQN